MIHNFQTIHVDVILLKSLPICHLHKELPKSCFHKVAAVFVAVGVKQAILHKKFISLSLSLLYLFTLKVTSPSDMLMRVQERLRDLGTPSSGPPASPRADHCSLLITRGVSLHLVFTDKDCSETVLFIIHDESIHKGVFSLLGVTSL